MASAFYVGIDQSLLRPGIAVFTEDGEVALATDLIVAPTLRGGTRLRWIKDSIMAKLKPYASSLVAGAMEGPSLGSTHREFDLGEISGVIKLLLLEAVGVEPWVIPPTTLKKFATGNGLAKKEDVLHAVKNKYGYDFTDRDDVADAFFLARMAWALNHPKLSTRRCELEVIAALLAPAKPKQRNFKIKSSL